MQRTPQPGAWTVAYFRFVHFSSCVKRHVPRWTRRSPNRTSQRFRRKIWQRGGKHGPSYFVVFRLLDRWDLWISSSSLTCFMQFAKGGDVRNSPLSFFVVSWHVHLCVCMNDFILAKSPVAFGATKLILKGKVTSQVTADIWENYSIYQMMPQVVGGCIWAAVGHERSQNAAVCRSPWDIPSHCVSDVCV